MFAIIRTGSKQYRVEPGTILDVEKLEDTSAIEFRDVLLVGNGTDIRVGNPVVPNAVVKAEFVGETKAAKVMSFKKIRREGKQWRKGHRQKLSRVKITEVVA